MEREGREYEVRDGMLGVVMGGGRGSEQRREVGGAKPCDLIKESEYDKSGGEEIKSELDACEADIPATGEEREGDVDNIPDNEVFSLSGLVQTGGRDDEGFVFK